MYKIEKQQEYIKLLDHPVINNYEMVFNFDEKIKTMLKTIINNNTYQNNKIILKNTQNLKIKDKTIIYKLFLNPILGKKFPILAYYDLYKNKIIFFVNNNLYIGHELIHMASSVVREDAIFSGFIQNFIYNDKEIQIGLGLTEGYTSHESDRLFGESKNAYYIQKDIVKKLEEIVGVDLLKKYFYTADLLGLTNELTKYDSFDNVIDFICKVDKIHNTKNKLMKLEITKSIYLKLYQYNRIKRKIEYEKGKITFDELEDLTLNFSKIYLLDVMRDFKFQDIIKERERIL